MATSRDLLQSFDKEANVVKAVVLYLGAEIRENAEGKFSHQFVLMPSKRDPKGGVVVVKHDKKLALDSNSVYYLEAESGSDRADNHFGVSIYWLRNPRMIKPVSSFREVEKSNG
jgi:hypothetical protein